MIKKLLVLVLGLFCVTGVAFGQTASGFEAQIAQLETQINSIDQQREELKGQLAPRKESVEEAKKVEKEKQAAVELQKQLNLNAGFSCRDAQGIKTNASKPGCVELFQREGVLNQAKQQVSEAEKTIVSTEKNIADLGTQWVKTNQQISALKNQKTERVAELETQISERETIKCPPSPESVCAVAESEKKALQSELKDLQGSISADKVSELEAELERVKNQKCLPGAQLQCEQKIKDLENELAAAQQASGQSTESAGPATDPVTDSEPNNPESTTPTTSSPAQVPVKEDVPEEFSKAFTDAKCGPGEGTNQDYNNFKACVQKVCRDQFKGDKSASNQECTAAAEQFVANQPPAEYGDFVEAKNAEYQAEVAYQNCTSGEYESSVGGKTGDARVAAEKEWNKQKNNGDICGPEKQALKNASEAREDAASQPGVSAYASAVGEAGTIQLEGEYAHALKKLESQTGFFDVRNLSVGNEHLLEVGGAQNTQNNILARVINVMARLFGTVAVLMFVIGAFFMITSQGDDNQLQKGKTIFLYTIIGLLLGFTAYIIVQFVINILFQT